MEEVFNREYSKLNRKQKEAVDTIEGPVMVVAGPGTGKTTLLTLRIANILRKTDAGASSILALTFTESGVKSMREKLRKIIGEAAFDVQINTFHGFAKSITLEFPEHFTHLKNCEQITDIEAESYIREILTDNKYRLLRPAGDSEFYIGKILGAISDSKQEAWEPSMIKDFAESEIERIKNSEESISSRGKTKGMLKGEALKRIEKCEKTILFSEVYESYESLKKERNKIDFDDLIFALLLTLRQDELLLQILQERYLYILVDEHQDTNSTQNEIVQKIGEFFDNPNIFVVGDEKQAIYRFQGASVENFLRFQKIWSGMKLIQLEENYRSHQGILDSTFSMIENNYAEKENEELRIKLLSGNGAEKTPIEICMAEKISDEEVFLVEKVKEMQKKYGQVAIITRKNRYVSRIFDILRRAGVEASAERGADIFQSRVGSMFFSILEFLNDPSVIEPLAETFSGGLWGLNFKTEVECIRAIKNGDLVELQEKLPAIKNLQNILGESSGVEYLIKIGEISGIVKMASKDPLYVEVWRAIINLSQEIARQNKTENHREIIKTLLEYKKTAENKIVKINGGKTKSDIIITTAHSSKGLEFESVLVPYATEESWISKNRNSYFVLPKEKEQYDEIRDERRLFYVALTRSKKHIAITSHSENFAGKPTTALRFISELDQSLIENKDIPEYKEIISAPQTTNDPGKIEKQEFAKRVLLEKGLSVTALNHFLECPNRFFYKSILKMPEAPNATSERGNAMHEAMSNVWNSKAKTKEDIEETMKTSIQNYFKKSLLIKHEKEAIQEELIKNAPIVASELLAHFNQEGEASSERWFETNFVSNIQGTEVEIRLHGKMDLVLEKEDEILVYDYKTKEAMSEKAIRGETASDTGDYFRQLVFYKILLGAQKKYQGKRVTPSLVFIKPNEKGECRTVTLPISEKDEEDLKEKIKTLIEKVMSGKILDEVCEDPECKYCRKN